MEWLHALMAQNDFPMLTAFLLGVLVAIHPCPLATNVAAIGYILRDHLKPFSSCLSMYILGRTVAYSLLGILLIFLIRGGAEVFHFGEQMTEWGERLLAPLLIIIGLYLLYNDLLHHHDHVPSTPKTKNWLRGSWGYFLLGILFALAFCPESGIVYFGMIVPMSVEASVGYLIPVSFAVGSALPVIALGYAFAYGMQSAERLKHGMRVTQIWLTRMVAVLFILAGIFCLFF